MRYREMYMEKILYEAKKRTTEKINLPRGNFSSDWFKCKSCGYEVMVKTLYDTIECSECGGDMERC